LTGADPLQVQVDNLKQLIAKGKAEEEVHLRTVDTLSQQINTLRAELDESASARETLQNELKWAVTRIRQTKSQSDIPESFRQKVGEMQKRIQAITKSVAEKEKEIDILKRMITDRDQKIRSYEGMRSDYEETRRNLLNEVEDLRSRPPAERTAGPDASALERIKALDGENKRLRANNEEHSARYGELKDKSRIIMVELKKATDQLESLNKESGTKDSIVLNLAPPLTGRSKRCDLCKGRKKVIVQDGDAEKEVSCPRCGGTGRT